MPARTDSLIQPEHDSDKVWRYLSFVKFVWLLQNRSLHFCRLDRLGDPFEGRLALSRDLVNRPGLSESEIHVLDNEKRKAFFVNCWHLSRYENDAMWKIYANGREGICIQSTYTKLRDAFGSDVCLGCVSYRQNLGMIDVSQSDEPIDLFQFMTSKRASFEHETEIRAILADQSRLNMCSEESRLQVPDTEDELGKDVPVNLRELVEAVYVYPFSERWFYGLVEATVMKYGYRFPVRRSEMEHSVSRG